MRTPLRPPDSVRRTTTIDSFRFEGAAGSTTVRGAGRDLLTPAAGAPVVLDTAQVELVLEPVSAVVAQVVSPAGLDALAGASVAGGWRRTLRDVAALDDRLLHRILDDLPGAFLGGGYAVVRAGAFPLAPRELLSMTDVCRGWAAGGSQHAEIALGRIPTPTGPVPTDLSVPEDPLAWHVTEVPPHTEYIRRIRRIDVSRGDSLDRIEVDAHFRDVWFPADGDAMVIHEYSLRARADLASFEVISIGVDAHALPWRECNAVTTSAQRLVGAVLGRLETTVRTQLTGTAGCTHLNDTFRGLDAVPRLAGTLPSPS